MYFTNFCRQWNTDALISSWFVSPWKICILWVRPLISANEFPHLAAVEQRCSSAVVLVTERGPSRGGWGVESSRLRPRGLAWLEPSWCDSAVSQALVCLRRSVGVCFSEPLRAWVFVSLSPCASACVCMQSGLCTQLYVYVCVCSLLLPPTGWSFTFRTGRRDRRLPGCARSLSTVRLAMPGIH